MTSSSGFLGRAQVLTVVKELLSDETDFAVAGPYALHNDLPPGTPYLVVTDLDGIEYDLILKRRN